MRFSGGRALEILATLRDVTVCKHVADKKQFHVTIPCFSLTLWRLPTQSRSRHFGGVCEKKTRSDHVTRNASAARNNEACGQGNGRQSFCTVLRYHKNTGHGNCFALAVFTLELHKCPVLATRSLLSFFILSSTLLRGVEVWNSPTK